MTRRTLHLLAAVVLATAAGPSIAALPARAAGSAGYCPDANGVTVVVDFNELGGGVVIRCAPGDQANGAAALRNAGFTMEGTVRWGDGFVCRINGKPGVSTEPCTDTPPTTAYWSYWHAPNGGSWTYSSFGVLNRKPPLGSFEGWSFSAGNGASSAPKPDATPTRPVVAPPPAPPAPAPAPARPTGAPPVGQPGGGGQAAPAGVSAPAVPATAEPAPTSVAPVSTAPSEAVDDVAVPVAGHTGLPLGTIAGIVVAAGLVVAAVLTARRRRRTPDA